MTGILILDQITKLIATDALQSGRIVKPFGNDLLWFLYVQNPGIAFGMQIFPPIVLTIINGAAGLLLGYFLFRYPRQALYQSIPFALVMAGAWGNMIDRIMIGQVTDFISVDMPNWIMDRFPVFNVADSAVSIGVLTLVAVSFIFPTERDEGSAGDE